MQNKATIARVKRIQEHLGVTSDGIIGTGTLTALEDRLFGKDNAPIIAKDYSLVVSKEGLNILVGHEIGSYAYYKKQLTHPVWPGGRSGVTIGIGYDLGANSKAQIRKDWGGKVSDADLALLLSVAGLSGKKAKSARKSVASVTISLDVAKEVFFRATLPRYAADTLRAFPGIDKLHPGAQAGLLSLVYNRGSSLSGSRRKEMKAIRPLVLAGDCKGIANQVRAMKRLWEGKGLPGLLRRRDDEAAMIEVFKSYSDPELVRV